MRPTLTSLEIIIRNLSVLRNRGDAYIHIPQKTTSFADLQNGRAPECIEVAVKSRPGDAAHIRSFGVLPSIPAHATPSRPVTGFESSCRPVNSAR